MPFQEGIPFKTFMNDCVDNGFIEDETLLKFYGIQLLFAIKAIHEHKYAHRDIKLEHLLLLNYGYLKLLDYGFAKEISEMPLYHTNCGTPEYKAPEVILRDVFHVESVDYWALGIVLYEMRFGRTPFISG